MEDKDSVAFSGNFAPLAVQGLTADSSGLLTSWDVHLRFGLDQKDGQKAQVVPHTSGINWGLSRPGISRLQRGPVLMPASGLLLASGSPEKVQRGRPRALWELQAASRPDCSASPRVGQQLGGTLPQRPLVPEALTCFLLNTVGSGMSFYTPISSLLPGTHCS